VIFFLARAISRMRTRRVEEEIEEIHESLFSWSGLGDDLRGLLGNIGKRFQRKTGVANSLFANEDDSLRLDVRGIYRRLLWEASRSGFARRTFETPVEYSGRVGRQFPAGREQLDALTEMYLDARYGEINAQEDQLDNANGLWKTLRGLLRGLRGE
jgi:hypothetical protein